MPRFPLVLIASTSMLAYPLLDITLKGTAVLLLAGIAYLLLRRDSAAKRHFVLTVAISLLVLMPFMALLLPEWRVLPAWMQPSSIGSFNLKADGLNTPSINNVSIATNEISSASLPTDESVNQLVESNPDLDHRSIDLQASTVSKVARDADRGSDLLDSSIDFNLLSTRLLAVLSFVYAIGVLGLLIRLAVSALQLRRSESRCTDGGPELQAELAKALSKMGLKCSVRLLLTPDNSVPIVWGLFTHRLRLPADASSWPSQQLQSVLLHEVAHLRRHDLIELLLTQLACALHWHNPIVWFVAWRLHFERERACDNLVLASGVRPSDYAQHLLEVSTNVTISHRGYLCGLAMTRMASLEGRLLAVLSQHHNRRGNTIGFVSLATLLGAIVAIPLMMLSATSKSAVARETIGEVSSPELTTLRPAETAATSAINDDTSASSLETSIENQLDWGEPVSGLRGALIIRSPDAGEPEGVYLVIQNVSQTPLLFNDTLKSDRLRSLYVSAAGHILFSLTNDEPTLTEVSLQPREVAYLPMLREDDQVADAMIEGIRKDSLQTWRAMLNIESPAGAGSWSGQLTTGETRCAVRVALPQPKNPEAQSLFKTWQNDLRLNGNIPGGLMRKLHDKVLEFIRNNEPDAAGGPYAQKMKPLEPRFDHTGDWPASDVVTLLDDIADVSTIPLETTREHLAQHTLQRGMQLPAWLLEADWGKPLPSGLRMAFSLEPRATEYHLGAEIKARILLHNSGQQPVAFITTTFQQPLHSAKRSDGSELSLDSTHWLTLSRMVAYRLAPGEYCEIYTPGLGVGAQRKDRDEWEQVRAGSWILCDDGDEVEFTPGPVVLNSLRGAEASSSDWWLDFITERLERETPVPSDLKEREYLLYRVVRELYGAAPSIDEGNAFAADTSADALKNLARLLSKHPYGKRSDGLINAGNTKFSVLPADADVANRPRVANNPGWYSLSDDLKLSVTRRVAGSQAINEASIIYFQPNQDNVVHDIPLPTGIGTWGAATLKDEKVLWVADAGAVRSLDFSDPINMKVTRYAADEMAAAPIPESLRITLNDIMDRAALEPIRNNSSDAPAEAD